MADFTPVALGVKPQQGMSLGDMLNVANAAQQYQQAQQMNPLALRRAEAEANTAEIGTKKEQFALDKSHLDVTGGALTGLESRARVHAQKGDIATALKELDHTEKYLNGYGIPSKKDGPFALAREALKNKDMAGYLAQIENMRGMQASAAEKYQANLPKLSSNAAGQAVAANPLTGQYDVMGTPETNPMGVRTQTFTDPVTGNIIQAPVTSQGQLGAPSNLMEAPSAQPAQVSQPPISPLSQVAKLKAVPLGATAETVKAQATEAMNSYMGSNKLLTDASTPGHIPTQEFVAKKLLTYLKDPSVNTGPIADVLAGKSNQATLSAKEQEVLKLIQQRIQNLNPRTDADAQSKKDAYGSFRVKKEALMDLVRQDLGSIHNQRLLAQGVLKAGGNPNAPDLQNVNTFKNDFTKFSQNPVLMNYIGIVGTKNAVDLDDQDKAALRKLFKDNNLSEKGRHALEDAREELIKMSAGGQ